MARRRVEPAAHRVTSSTQRVHGFAKAAGQRRQITAASACTTSRRWTVQLPVFSTFEVVAAILHRAGNRVQATFLFEFGHLCSPSGNSAIETAQRKETQRHMSLAPPQHDGLDAPTRGVLVFYQRTGRWRLRLLLKLFCSESRVTRTTATGH